MTAQQRTKLIAAMVDAMLERGEIFEDQTSQTRDELMASSDKELLEAANELGLA